MSSMHGVRRQARFTLLIVAEGHADVAFVRHVRAVYGAEIGRAIKLKNAKGKGARNVLTQATRCARHEGYDKVVILIDTDVDWDDTDRAKARTNQIGVLESTPCLEAWLLDIIGINTQGATAMRKQAFSDYFGCEAHSPNLFEQHYSREILDKARDKVEVLGKLLNHMSIPKPIRG
jgi:hypothetical protein